MKLRLTLTAALLSSALVGLSAGEASAASTAWGSPAYNGARSNYNPTETLLTPTTVKRLSYRRGIAPAPATGCIAHESNPVVVGQTVYSLDGSRISAFDAASGRRLWQTAPTMDVHHIPGPLAVSNGRLLFISLDCESVSSPNDQMLAFDTRNGAALWSATIVNYVGSAVVGDQVVMTGSLDAEEGASVVGISAVTGQQIWERGCLGALVVGANVLVSCPGYESPTGTATTQALALSDGHTVWSKAGYYGMQRGDKPNATGTDVYARLSTGFLADLASSTGKIKWKSASEKGPVLAVAGRSLLVSCDDGMLCSLDRATGSRLWKVARPVSRAVVAGDVVYTQEAGARQLSTGAAITTAQPYSQAGPLIVVNGRVIVYATRLIEVYAIPAVA